MANGTTTQQPDGATQQVQYGGVTHSFPSDFTNDDIAKALKSWDAQQAANPPSVVYNRPAGTADAQFSAQPNTFSNWLQNAEADVRYGGARTAIGRVMTALGAQGTDVGSQAGAGGMLASPVLGPIHTAQGVAMTPSHPIMGPLKAVGGALETATIPGMFTAGPAANIVGEAVPNTARAGDAIQAVQDAAGALPVDTSGPMQIAQRIKQLGSAGGQVPKVVRDFLNRMGVSVEGETVTQAPSRLTFNEGRDFYNNSTRLASGEYQNLTAPVQRLVGQFTDSLHNALVGSADQVGLGQAYDNAIGEYASASQLSRVARAVGKYALKQGLQWGPGIAGYEALQAIRQRR